LKALVLIAAAAALIAAATPISFTSTQVSAGSTAYAAHCAMCHGSALEGGAGPALSGANFKTLSSKVKANVSDIFTYMTTNMPLNAPASLSHTEYVNILTFILSRNGYRSGSSALTFGQASASKASIVRD
jgi:alcohol dehydrogenase (cytochrome c)